MAIIRSNRTTADWGTVDGSGWPRAFSKSGMENSATLLTSVATVQSILHLSFFTCYVIAIHPPSVS
eukprot:1362310-Amorphochlora_amoeboformis.AAC.1